MKLKLVTYCIAAALSLSVFLYAGPDYRKLNYTPNGTPADKQVAAVSVKKQDVIKSQKNNSHHFKSRILNSARPVQRCIKNLKI